MACRKAPRKESQHTSAARHSVEPDPCIPHEVARLVALSAYPPVLANMRLASKDLARAVDTVIEELWIDDWGRKNVTSSPWMQYVSHVKIVTAPKWAEVRRLAGWLPSLSSISIPCDVGARMPVTVAAALTALTRLDLGTDSNTIKDIRVPKQASLPGLRAANFKIGIHPVKLSDVVRFAPHLEQLYCEGLIIGDFLGRLAKCTHYGGTYLLADAKGSDLDVALLDTAAAFAEAFPSLRVLSRVPVITNDKHQAVRASSEARPPSEYAKTLAAAHTISAVSGVTAACCINRMVPTSTRIGSVTISDHCTALQGLNVLSISDTTDAIHTLQGIGQLQSLQHVHLLLDEPIAYGGEYWHVPFSAWSYMPAWQQVLRELGTLPQLKFLALPAALLCHKCCGVSKEQYSTVYQGLCSLACRTDLQQLAFLGIRRMVPGGPLGIRPNETSHWEFRCSGSRWHEYRFLGDLRVDHHKNCMTDMHSKLCRVAQEATAKNPTSCGCDVILKLGLQRGVHACLDNLTGSGLWGVYGPAKF